ncbi:MAG: Wzy polymerase domain-containing protein [Pseudoalteromonas tetraodonis]|nr:Wzy polymerase domain-containing protein [Pseudoalteromonas tetraodonis]
MLHINKTALLFTPLLLISIFFYIPNAGGFGFSLPFNSFALMSLSWALFIVIYNSIKSKQPFKLDRFLVIAFTALLLLLLPSFWSEQTQLYSALSRFIFIILGLYTYFCLLQIKNKKTFNESLLYLICFSSLLSACFALYQNYLMTADSYFAIKIEYGRPTGIFQQVNVLASYTATGIAISFYLLTGLKARSLKSFLYLCIFVNSWALFLTQSRTGLLAYGVILCWYIFLIFKEKEKRKLAFLLSGIMASFILAKTLPYSTGNEYVSKKEMFSTPNARLQIYQDSLGAFLEKPIIGHGYGSFHRVITDLSATKAADRNNINIGKKVTHPHNEFILWLVEGGVIAAFAMLLLFYYLCSIIFKGSSQNKFGLFLLITPILLHCSTEHPFYQSFIHFIVFTFLLFYITNACNLKEKSIQINLSFLKITNLLIVVFITLFSITAIQSSIILRHYIYNEPNNHILLSKTLNPFIEYKFKEIQINTLKLEVAIQNQSNTEIINFLNWSKEFLQVYPSDYIYFERIRALIFLGLKEQAEAERKLAKTLYPQNISWDKGIWEAP